MHAAATIAICNSRSPVSGDLVAFWAALSIASRYAVPLLASQRFGGIDTEAASGRTQRSEDADEQHERGRAGEDTGNRQAADLFDRYVPAGEVGGKHPRRRTGTDLPERAPEYSRHQMARLGAFDLQNGRVGLDELEVLTLSETIVPALISAAAPVVAGDQMVLLLGNYRGDIWIRDIG